MHFWRDYWVAFWHYIWIVVIAGIGAILAIVVPFIPTSSLPLPREVAWGIAGGGIVIAQALAARKLAIDYFGRGGSVVPPPGPQALNSPTVGQVSGTVIFAEKVIQNYNVGTVAPDAEVGVKGMVEPDALEAEEPELAADSEPIDGDEGSGEGA